MVHHRFNEKETNPNPYINFITSLPCIDGSEQESARQLLRALAAQVRPIMKSHGFTVNSLEEYEHNNVFAGRNWNAGETIELVLRRQNGTFLPIFWHMNHGPAFQALWKQLRAEVRGLQDKGYYGDGYWSSGTRLADSAKVSGVGIEPGDLPEYVCGGAQSRKRPVRRQRKPRNSTITPSNSTGRQTAKPRKAGSRITSKTAFVGTGSSLLGDGEDVKGKGTGFRKQANSKRARDERALATEKRLLVLQNQAKASSSSAPELDEWDTDSDDETRELVPESDSERRETLLTCGKEDLVGLKSGDLWQDFREDFNFGGLQGRSSQATGHPPNKPSRSESADVTLSKAEGKRKAHDSDDDDIASKAPKKSHEANPNYVGQKGKTEQSTLAPFGLPVAPLASSGAWACKVCTL
ncbi:hypothetical protein H0H92_005758 [Tricholoma furcatifolium]|nr:hypothetical protein H0H92_005758 [Tricholoma furcatifolium]